MTYLLIAVPLLALLSGVLLYRLHGHGEVFKLDLIQFFYAFIMSPVLFIWAKSVLFLILRTELGINLSQGALFFYDTLFSTCALYVYAFVVMHSLTASFNLKMFNNPKYNLFLDSEYLHLWVTHIVIFLGGLVLVSMIGIFNALFPLSYNMARSTFYTLDIIGLLAGVLLFIAMIPLSDPKQKGRNFRRLMKVSFGMLFVGHVTAQFILNIPFNGTRVAFWMSAFMLAGLVLCSALVRSSRIRRWVDRMAENYKRQGWHFRMQVFSKQKT